MHMPPTPFDPHCRSPTMSRRPNPAADRAEQNRATLKKLVTLEGNRTCADCKRNKHPRWASWNLGVFICIRCSGIHRGMGTHISKVKSVDLDTWTDEQLQSVLRWGNARANRYWEAKLAPGHVPSEAKMENFIRTKYESQRWTMDGPLPDPATLDADDDDMPLSQVQEKVQVERSASQRLAGPAASATSATSARQRPPPAIDLFGDEPAPPRPSTGPPAATATPPRQETVPPKQNRAGDSLLGLDFLGGGGAGGTTATAQPARPSSTGPAAAAASRPDLKQSILSLYASKPPAAAQPQPQHARQDSFGGLASPRAQPSSQPSSFGGLNDAFSTLSFAAAPAPKPSPFSGLDSFSSTKAPPTTSSSNLFGGGGNFFNAKSSSTPVPSQLRTTNPASRIGDFEAFASSAAPPKHSAPATSGMNDLLDLSMPSAPAPRVTSQPIASPHTNSAFNLTSPAVSSGAAAAAATPAPAAVNYGGGLANMDAWGGNDVWASSAPSQPATTAMVPKSPRWGAPAQVTADEDFGGWSSAAPASSRASAPVEGPGKPASGFGGASDDLFSNVWE